MLKLISVLLVTLAVLVWGARQMLAVERQYEAALQQPASQSGETHHFTELQITEFDIKGQRKSSVSSPSVNYDPDIQQSTLTQPYILLFGDNSSPTEVRAKHATLTHKNNQLVLTDNVQIQTNPDKRKGVLLTTSKLAVDIKNKFAHTDQPVTITTDNITMDAVGMDLDYATQRIKLLSSVRGAHDS